MVRRIAQAVHLYSIGSISMEELRRATDEEKVTIRPSPPEFLILMDVSYGFDFTTFGDKKIRSEVARRSLVKKTECALLYQLLAKLS
jgi:tRNA U38,U39,U40 pseudouridine synthase TruA